ncbi:hypothetical protein GGI12_001118 [Dipsacomyces acuminosporus]|nr:hypothetical protein GGI12_001118 [Dipsacomyces acuminosporus]
MAQTHIATTPNDGRGLRGLELPYIGNGLNVPQRIVAERQELLAGILNNDIGDNLRSNTTQVLRLMSPANALSYGLNDGDNDSTTVRDNRVDLLLRTRISTGLYNRLQEFINERVSDEGSSSAEAPSLVLNRRRRAAASKGDEPTKSTSSATVGGKSSNSKNTRNNVILLRGAADVGKSYLMMELALRLLSLNRDEVRVVYIKDCAEWARKDGLYGKIEYLVRALKLAFIDDEGFDQMFVDFPPTRAEAAGVTAEDVFKHIESYCEAKAKNGAALKVVFFFDNFEAAYKSVNSAGQRDIESVFGRIRIRPHSEIMEIINHYKKHVSSSKGTENSITDSSNINLTKLRVSEALSEIAKRKNDDSFTEYIVYLVTSESAATGFYTEYKKKYHSCGEFDLRVLGITELQELHDIRIRHFTGN